MLADTTTYFTPEFLNTAEGVDLDAHIKGLPEDLRDTAEACALILAVVKDLDKYVERRNSTVHSSSSREEGCWSQEYKLTNIRAPGISGSTLRSGITSSTS